MSDGIKLVLLAEVLSGRRFKSYNKRAPMRNQKLDNVNLVLRFFQDEEGIKIVTIGRLLGVLCKHQGHVFQTAPTLWTTT